jgi:hypothetical protein
MSRITVLASFLLIAVSVCAAREPWAPTQTAATGAQPVGHAAIPVLLSKSLDAKKLKVGDEVTAKTSVSLRGGGILIPSGSIVIGHVTSAEARSKGDPQSSLGLAFDKVEVLGGKVLLIHGLIRAVGPNPNPEPNTGAAEAGTIAADTGHDQGLLYRDRFPTSASWVLPTTTAHYLARTSAACSASATCNSTRTQSW